MKSNSRKIRKTTDTAQIKTFWSKKWNEMNSKSQKLENDLLKSISYFDSQEELRMLQGQTGTPLQDLNDQLSAALAAESQQLLYQASRMASLKEETKKGASSYKIESKSGLIDEIFSAFEESRNNIEQGFALFDAELPKTNSLAKSLKEPGTIKGFDIDKNLDLELVLNFEGVQDFVTDEEEKMINDYYEAADILQDRFQLELEELKLNDVKKKN